MQNKKVVESYKKDWKRFFEEISPYEDYHLRMYPQNLRLSERFEDLSYHLSNDSEDVGKYYLDETENILNARLGKMTKNDFIVGIKLKNEMIKLDADIKENAFNIFSNVTDKLVNLMGWEQNVPISFFNQFKELEETLFSMVSTVNGVRLDEDELIYINRYDFVRGLEHDVSEEMESGSVDAITNTKINPSYTASLKLESDQDEGFVSFVVIDEFPHNMAESDLFFEAQSLPFEVEVNVKAQVENKSKTKLNAGMKSRELNESSKEQLMSEGDIDDSITDSGGVLRNLQNELKDNDTFLNNWLAAITVTGKTKKECLVKAKQVKRFFRQLNIVSHVPVADQLNLFYRLLPGEKLDITSRSWLQKTTQDGISENLFAVNSDIGNKIGFFIGWVDRFNEHESLESAKMTSRNPILHHPFLANQNIKGSKKRSPHVLITGDTGNGKSYLAKLLYIFMSFLNVSSTYIDPKKEFRKWINKAINDSVVRRDYPLFVEHLKKFKFITLDHEQKENWGALDPVTFLPASQAKELIQDIFSQVYDFKGKDDVHTAFLRSITEVTQRREKGEQVGSLHIIEIMQSSNEIPVKKAGDFLYEVVADSILKLCVHDGTNGSLSLNDRISIIEIENIDLPKATDPIETYTSSQLKSNAIMMALGKFCELFGTKDKEENTAVFIDEAWMITASQQGKKVEKSMKRIGRSFNNALYFISQSTKDAIREEENETGNFGVAFAFDEENERSDILKWMNMEDTKENQEVLESMYQGQCLMKDMYGRSGKITVENLFEEWDGALETVNKSEVAYAEEKYL
ncbi:ATP-binding protein [Oceanobacillus sp. FSL K6-0251]|uniref:ATP-binding protein n=1 Tax=Oceanobacillus sp. FSL K6-0251 TaxID=2921602 RepID=UPI0030FA5D1E